MALAGTTVPTLGLNGSTRGERVSDGILMGLHIFWICLQWITQGQVRTFDRIPTASILVSLFILKHIPKSCHWWPNPSKACDCQALIQSKNLGHRCEFLETRFGLQPITSLRFLLPPFTPPHPWPTFILHFLNLFFFFFFLRTRLKQTQK